jgi:hypothetical protein
MRNIQIHFDEHLDEIIAAIRKAPQNTTVNAIQERSTIDDKKWNVISCFDPVSWTLYLRKYVADLHELEKDLDLGLISIWSNVRRTHGLYVPRKLKLPGES